jgi:hypothetical protein
LADEGHFSERWAKNVRVLPDKYVLNDPLAAKDMAALRPGDFEDLKKRLRGLNIGKAGEVKHLAGRSINIILGALKAAIREGYHRGDIDHDPTAGVGKLRENSRETGIFTREEMADILSRPELFAPPKRYFGVIRGQYPENLAYNILSGLRPGRRAAGSDSVVALAGY